MTIKRLTLLDCTLRDGGYYNNWDFSKDLIEDYLKAMSSAKIEFVELGFRFYKKDIYLGPCAYTTPFFLESLNIPKDLKIGIMINAADIVSNKLSKTDIDHHFFQFSNKNKIEFVRFACHLKEVPNIIPYCNKLKKMGIIVGLNLMQISEINDSDLEKVSKLISKSEIDIFYFADSLGNLEPKDIKHIYNTIRKKWKKNIGFHAHDNMGRALINCVAAVNNGINWIDSTVTGMGRGAGNAKTELALLEFSKFSKKGRDISLLLKLIDETFVPMKNEYGWGSNPYYYLAGQFSIHPTYIQSMQNDLKLSSEEILTAIENLKKRDGRVFNKSFIETGDSFYNKRSSGTWDPYKVIKGRDVLIIGSGPGSINHSKAIENFIKKKKPFVIALNTQKTINEKLINLRVCCYTLRIMSDTKEFKKLSQPLVLPFDSLPLHQKNKYKKIKIYNYGLEIKKDKFKFMKKSTITPNSLTICYALSIANSGKAKQIFASGLDGYKIGDRRGIEMEDTLKIYNGLKKKSKLIAITPTRYKINSTSIYAF